MDAENAADRDLELVALVARGDEAAFEELVGRHRHSVLNIIHRYVGEYDAADDIAQEVFVIVWNKAAGFKGRAKFSTWLYRVVVNQCLQFRRKRKTAQVSLDSLDADHPPESLQVEDDYDRRRRAMLVRQAVGELPDRQRMALILSHYKGLSYREIAETMDLSVASVESLLFRAKDSLRKKLVDPQTGRHL